MQDQLSEQIDAAARLIVESTYVVAIIGSGLSAESGIPTFQGQGGLWTRFGEPKDNGYDIFMRDPVAWWQEQLSQDDSPPRAEFREAIEKAQVRSAIAQVRHISFSIRAFVRLEVHRLKTGVSGYEAKTAIIRDAIRQSLDQPIYILNSTA